MSIKLMQVKEQLNTEINEYMPCRLEFWQTTGNGETLSIKNDLHPWANFPYPFIAVFHPEYDSTHGDDLIIYIITMADFFTQNFDLTPIEQLAALGYAQLLKKDQQAKVPKLKATVG